MAKNHILRIGEDGNPISLYTYDAQNNACTITAVPQWTDGALKQIELVLLVPATWVYHSQTQVASKNMDLLAKSIPFAIEEELSNEVEDNYFAFKLNENGSQAVIAIEKNHLDQLNLAIDKNNLTISSIHSEVDWLPEIKDSVVIWSDTETSLVRFGEEQTMRIANHQIKQLLTVFAQDMKKIVCNDVEKVTGVDLPVSSTLDASACCAHLINQEAIDLYVDELKTTTDTEDTKQWFLPKVLGLLLVVSWVAIQGIQWLNLQQSIDELKTQQEDMLKSQFGDVAPVELVDPFAAFQSRLKLQDSQSGSGTDILLDVVDYIGQTTQQHKSVRLGGLRLVEQKMEIQITAPNIAFINEFHQSLQQRAYEYNVQIGVNELSDDNSFRSILTVVPR